MQKKCKPFKLALFTLTALISGSLWADDVRINVIGEITAQTCSVVGASDRTINMKHYTIDEVQGQTANSTMLSGQTEAIDLRCPAAHGITANMADTGKPTSPVGQKYLENIAPATNRARNVAVQVYLLTDYAAGKAGGPLVNKTDKEVRAPNSALDYASTTDTYRIGIRPFYYFTGAGSTVTPGDVKATMTLTITYK